MMTVNKNFLKRLDEISKIAQAYGEIPFNEKLDELKKLGSERKNLEKQLKNAESRISILESFEDIRDYKIETDEMAVELLRYFADNDGKMNYGDFKADFESKNAKLLGTHYLIKLKLANFLEITGNVPNEIINLTDKGMKLGRRKNE